MNLTTRSVSPGSSTQATVVRAQSGRHWVLTSVCSGPVTMWSIPAASRSSLTRVWWISIASVP